MHVLYEFVLSLGLVFAQDKVAYVPACPLIFFVCVPVNVISFTLWCLHLFLIAIIPSTVLSTSYYLKITLKKNAWAITHLLAHLLFLKIDFCGDMCECVYLYVCLCCHLFAAQSSFGLSKSDEKTG